MDFYNNLESFDDVPKGSTNHQCLINYDINATNERKRTCLHTIVMNGDYVNNRTDPDLEEKGIECLKLVLARKDLDIDAHLCILEM